MEAAALELAKVVNCDTKSDEGCGVCPSCRAINECRNPNVNLIIALPAGKGEKSGDDPLAKLTEDEVALVRTELRKKSEHPYLTVEIPKATTIKINSVRQIRTESSRSMFSAGKRVFVIIDADMLGDEAGNALLKILEEPHDDTMLILTTSRPGQLLPTIQSRCQQVQFDPVEAGEIAAALERFEGIPHDDAALLASMAGGSYGRAIALNGSGIRERCSDAVAYLRVALYKSNRDLLEEIDRLQSAYDRQGIVELLSVLEAWMRDALLIDEGAETMQSGLDRETSAKFAAHHHAVRYNEVFASLMSAVSLLGKNAYISLVLITLALDLREAILTPPVETGRVASAPAGIVPVS